MLRCTAAAWSNCNSYSFTGKCKLFQVEILLHYLTATPWRPPPSLVISDSIYLGGLVYVFVWPWVSVNMAFPLLTTPTLSSHCPSRSWGLSLVLTITLILYWPFFVLLSVVSVWLKVQNSALQSVAWFCYFMYRRRLIKKCAKQREQTPCST